jgi:predicted GNAT superfamily acetyltransferase
MLTFKDVKGFVDDFGYFVARMEAWLYVARVFVEETNRYLGRERR